MKWASWSNDRSFWVQKEYPLQLLSDVGFDLVLEQFDCDKDIVGQWTTTGWRKTNSRVLLAAIKSTAKPEKRRQGPTSSLVARLSGAVDVRRAQAGNVAKRDLGRV